MVGAWVMESTTQQPLCRDIINVIDMARPCLPPNVSLHWQIAAQLMLMVLTTLPAAAAPVS
jgi:hypothetical protein